MGRHQRLPRGSYREAVLSNVHYAALRIMPTSVAKPAWEAVIAVKDAA
jgi:hypothetical protein